MFGLVCVKHIGPSVQNVVLLGIKYLPKSKNNLNNIRSIRMHSKKIIQMCSSSYLK